MSRLVHHNNYIENISNDGIIFRGHVFSQAHDVLQSTVIWVELFSNKFEQGSSMWVTFPDQNLLYVQYIIY